MLYRFYVVYIQRTYIHTYIGINVLYTLREANENADKTSVAHAVKQNVYLPEHCHIRAMCEFVVQICPFPFSSFAALPFAFGSIPNSLLADAPLLGHAYPLAPQAVTQ